MTFNKLRREITIESLVIEMHDLMLHPGEKAYQVAEKMVDAHLAQGGSGPVVQHYRIVGNALIALESKGLISFDQK